MFYNFFKQKVYFIALTIIVVMPSCSDKELEVQPRDRLTDANVWTDPGTADLFLNDIYTSLPDGNNWYDPVENWSDNSICGFAWPTSRGLIQQSLQSPSNANISGDIGGVYDWATQYTNVRRCNVFIKNVTASPALTDDYKKEKIAEARTLRAYFYQNLWMTFGGVPIITDVLNIEVQGDSVFKPRNTSEETLQFITAECSEAYNNLPDIPSSGKVGKGAALAIKGWCELYAGKYADAAATNKKIMDELPYGLDSDYAALFLTKGSASREAILYR